MRTSECSLNVSVTLRCHDARCRDVVPTFEPAGQQKWKKQTEKKSERGVNEMGAEEREGWIKKVLKD